MAEQEKQCRICLDGMEAENELGRLIRPCLCKGSISVRWMAIIILWNFEAYTFSTVCSCRMPQQMAQDILVEQRLLCVSTVPLQVSVCKDPNIRPSY
jgi:E3 ubiquitin-protein ligase DOA10